MDLDRCVYGALAVIPTVALGLYALYSYNCKKRMYIRLNIPDRSYRGNFSGLLTKTRNLIYRNTMQDRLWNYVESSSHEGNSDSVLAAFDDYCYNYEWSWAIGDKKASILTTVVQEAAPKMALECGTFCGYSAIVIASNMPDDGRLFTIEANPKSVEVAQKIINRAGFGDKVTVINSYSYDVIPKLRSEYGIEHLDFLFLDHFGDGYVKDLKAIEKCGHLRTGSVVFADNINGEGSPGFSQFIHESGLFECKFYESDVEYLEGISDGMERGIYYKDADMYTGETLGLA